jgi:hypothetical protein
VEVKCPTILANSGIVKKLPEENNRPIGENSPNLVTLERGYRVFGNV